MYQMFLRLGTMIFKMRRDVHKALHVCVLGNRFSWAYSFNVGSF